MDHPPVAAHDAQSTPFAAVVALLGLPASGKSTVAAALASSTSMNSAQRLDVHVASLDHVLAQLSAGSGDVAPTIAQQPERLDYQRHQLRFDPALWKVRRSRASCAALTVRQQRC
jgi:hypothetical protein